MTLPARLVVLISGEGTNLQAILDACRDAVLPARVTAVFSNRGSAPGLERARQAGVPAIAFPKPREMDRLAYDRSLAEAVLEYAPDWVVLAGWMRLLSMSFLSQFPGRVMNIHPALPGTFPGVEAIERAYQAWQAGKIDHSGVMVHLVPDEGIDSGPVLAQETVAFQPGDTLDHFTSRIHAVEHRLYVETLYRLIT
ncbi:MAG TPA: phosphoribosylglycinamide formyltransferase [Anaerolineaceae bacterium]|jgi:formyltetrahydrofolate-dependent phosphoribosylglycinamide formyltransferase|nr:phosphoribosylglycinamide formyltransferase [Anaerolineaceae bacterium]HOU44989.1 phosphoribosylglycinamide formyltransferase [Anaerolineaceae bacterium]HPA33633.1 phosphoribosylglycinamide formyltransferase [Anaerolineaceae bacterium]HQF46391.1 phosphoribosylglycinamide formyltransferase [Anaerolineaceae bacterium]HQH36260.1 phosphoribosylglycinamide formyltransferase [Anaerolineaceae bacterium]